MTSLKNKKVLITSGPTWVSIDPMRVISNRATGELGQKLTLALVKEGAKVTLLEGPVTQPLKADNVNIKKFCFYDELKELLTTELKKKYDIVIHNAAVSDYQLKSPYQVKVGSNKKRLTIDLFPTEKLINQIKHLAPKVILVGFKLEDFKKEKEVIEEAQRLIENSKCDLVVANTLKGGYKAYLLDHNTKILNHSSSRAQLTKNLISALKETR
jgi:phosphopantothenoylcysteine decarboxylase/phosphopantothenate--cysteine ligase